MITLTHDLPLKSATVIVVWTVIDVNVPCGMPGSRG